MERFPSMLQRSYYFLKGIESSSHLQCKLGLTFTVENGRNSANALESERGLLYAYFF